MIKIFSTLLMMGSLIAGECPSLNTTNWISLFCKEDLTGNEIYARIKEGIPSTDLWIYRFSNFELNLYDEDVVITADPNGDHYSVVHGNQSIYNAFNGSGVRFPSQEMSSLATAHMLLLWTHLKIKVLASILSWQTRAQVIRSELSLINLPLNR